MAKVGINAVVDAAAKRLKKIRDIPNYRDSQEYKVINEKLKQHQWNKDENNFLVLDSDEKVRLYQETIYHSGTTRNKGNLWWHDQPWMQEKGVLLGNVNKKGTPSRVKAKRSFSKVEDPMEIGFNDDARYKGTQAAQEADRKWNLKPGTTGYDEVHARLTELRPLLEEAIPNYNEVDMFIELKNTNKRQVKDRLELIKRWNKDLKEYEGVTEKTEFYSAGHASSRAKGGPATASNYGFPETQAQNYKTQNKEDLPKWVLEEIGVDTSWTMWVDRYVSDVYGLGLIEKTDAQRFLTDFDKLDILNRKVDWTTALQARIDDLNNVY
jgi:hypothetical protein